MADKNIQMKIKNGAAWDDLFPATKLTLVNGLAAALSAKVDQEAGKRLSSEDFTTAEKSKLSGIATGANNYTHPTGSGNNHIPAGGSSGNLLKYSAAGTAAWGNLAAADIPTLALAKISDAGTAASRNTGTVSGNVPVLDSNGKLDPTVLPALAISDTFVVASQAAMLALTAEVGDIAVRTDLNKTYILRVAGASTLANWQEILAPTAAVSSVAGKTGAVTLSASDVGLGNVTNESKATMFANAALTGTPTAPTAATATNSTQVATTAFVKAALTAYPTGAVIAVSASEPSGADFWYQEI